jgi:signal transduction histidine kinase
MISTELGRLARLMAPPDPTGRDGDGLLDDASELRVMDLDETIGTLVVSQEARGNRVRWSPSGLRVNAQPDAVAEVISVLLDNAAKHGRSAAEVTLTQTGDIVEVAVHDDGPGVDESLRTRLFTWGVRGPRSTGQGIGLHIAHELAQRQGGYLELRDSRSGGATFVMGLPLDRVRNRESMHGDDESLEADLA